MEPDPVATAPGSVFVGLQMSGTSLVPKMNQYNFVFRRDFRMKVEVSEEPLTELDAYAQIPITFEVQGVLDIAGARHESGNYILTERPVDVRYVKDYDTIDRENPIDWASRFDLSNWGLFAARVAGQRVGGAAVAFDTPGLDMLEDRKDLAVLWDIRVAPDSRGQGIGSRLFRAAESWARARSCRQLKVETQNINVPACRFYASQGCVLRAVDRFAYPLFPDEIRMLWYKDLG